MKEDAVYTAKEVCEILRISTYTLKRLEEQGKLNPIAGIGWRRFAREDVERLIRGAAA